MKKKVELRAGFALPDDKPSQASMAMPLWLQLASYCICMQVYVVGEVGIIEELDLKGIQHIGGPEDADKKIELKPGFALPHDESVCPLTVAMLSSSKAQILCYCSSALRPAFNGIFRLHKLCPLEFYSSISMP